MSGGTVSATREATGVGVHSASEEICQVICPGGGIVDNVNFKLFTCQAGTGGAG